MISLLAATLLMQAPSDPTAEDMRVAMAWGVCLGNQSRLFAARPGTDDEAASRAADACAELEQRVAVATVRIVGRERAAGEVRRLHADAHDRALGGVRETRGGAPASGPGTEFRTWGRCVSQRLAARAGDPGTAEEIVAAAEHDCSVQEAAAHAGAVRELGPARADAQMTSIRTEAHAFHLRLLAEISASRTAQPSHSETQPH